MAEEVSFSTFRYVIPADDMGKMKYAPELKGVGVLTYKTVHRAVILITEKRIPTFDKPASSPPEFDTKKFPGITFEQIEG